MSIESSLNGAIVRKEIPFVDYQLAILESHKKKFGFSNITNFSRHIHQNFIESNGLTLENGLALDKKGEPQ